MGLTLPSAHKRFVKKELTVNLAGLPIGQAAFTQGKTRSYFWLSVRKRGIVTEHESKGFDLILNSRREFLLAFRNSSSDAGLIWFSSFYV